MDESASEVGLPAEDFAAPLRWLAGLRGGVRSEGKGGRRCRKSALLAKAARGGMRCAQKKKEKNVAAVQVWAGAKRALNPQRVRICLRPDRQLSTSVWEDPASVGWQAE